jgi:hypothetical protein
MGNLNGSITSSDVEAAIKLPNNENSITLLYTVHCRILPGL